METAATDPGPEEAATAAAGPLVLQVWLPPQFDPDGEGEAARLLKERLEAFAERRPGVHVVARVKAADGPGGLLDALTTASAAAPLALPDLIALPYPLLETAAIKGLLHPFDGLSTAMNDPDWFDYARQLSNLQDRIFGLPFAGDALALIYRPAAVPTPPADWAAVLQAAGPLAFPAAEPQALFTLALYQSAGGPLRDDQGRPVLDLPALTGVLEFYQQAEQSERMPFWLTQFQSGDQVWETFLEKRAELAAVWASRYLGGRPPDASLAVLPTRDGVPYTFATGWVWALSTPQPGNQEASAELAEFLTEGAFLARWTEAAGFLPPRPSSLEAWSDPATRSTAGQILASARRIPSGDVLVALGPLFQQAAGEVLKEQKTPAEAAQEALAGLPAPGGP